MQRCNADAGDFTIKLCYQNWAALSFIVQASIFPLTHLHDDADDFNYDNNEWLIDAMASNRDKFVCAWRYMSVRRVIYL